MSNTKQTITIIGGGNMGEALVKGLCKDFNLYVIEANVQRANFLKKKYRISSNIHSIAGKSSVVIFAVKPQDMLTAMAETRSIKDNNPLYVSIAAGLTTQFFESYLGGKPRVIRTMPNMPALIGEGITGICVGRYAKPNDLKLAQILLNTIGDTVVVKESMIDALTAICGSGPAYVFLFVEQWMQAAIKLGFKQLEAKQLVYKTLLGSVHLLMQSEFDAGALRAKVTSKGGTTQAAMDVFLKGKFDRLMINALLAAKNRAKQLAK